MDHISLINDTVERIKKNFPGNCSVVLEGAAAGVESDIRQLEEAGIILSEDIKDIYRKYSVVQISWNTDEGKLYGCFDLIPPGSIIGFHDDMAEIAEQAAEYAVSDEEKSCLGKLDIIKNMYPVFEFRSGDRLCINNITGQAVFYDYSVNELYDGDINGLVIAESFDDLIVKWSRILFLEGFWWETGEGRCLNDKGIDLENEYLRNIMEKFR